MAMRQGSNLTEETHLWSMYEQGIDYQIKTGLRHNIPKYVDFYEGRQWPAPTENTKNLPRPVVNIVKMICRSKKASILSTPVKILYKTYKQGTDIDKLNSFAQSIFKEMNQDGIDRLAIDDGVKKGSYFFHYYWDKYASTPSGRAEGGVRCELIDPLNIFFSNPKELDEQKQRWILISTPTDIRKIMELCDENVNLSQIRTDEEGEITSNPDKAITLLTRYFKIDGEVWCERGTKYSIINKPFKLTPSIQDVKALFTGESKEDAAKIEQEKDKSSSAFAYFKELTEKRSARATLYPVVCGFYERREGSIYGISEVEGTIPNQKAINFNIAMTLLNSQQCAWGKYIALPNALKGQVITNSPGQVLIDYSETGNGIKRMSEEGISQVPMSIAQEITDLTRNVTGASDIISGDAINANLSGVAIAQLQAQAEVPIEDLRAAFWEAKKKQGLVVAQFIRLYYYDREFIRKSRDENGKECEICDRFFSKDYENALFDVVVEPTRGTRATISSDVNMLDTCLKNGSISLEAYIKAYPEGALSNKSAILNQIEEEKADEIHRLRKELERYKNGKTLDPVSMI